MYLTCGSYVCDRDLDAKPYCDRSCDASGRRRKRSVAQAQAAVHKEVHSGELRVQVRPHNLSKSDPIHFCFSSRYIRWSFLGRKITCWWLLRVTLVVVFDFLPWNFPIFPNSRALALEPHASHLVKLLLLSPFTKMGFCPFSYCTKAPITMIWLILLICIKISRFTIHRTTDLDHW